MTNTPSVSFFVWPGFSSAAAAAAPGRCGVFLSASGSFTTLPFSSNTSSRTVVAWIGIATTPLRVAVVMSAVHVNPGRTSGISSSSVTTTLKFVACASPRPPWPGSGCCRFR